MKRMMAVLVCAVAVLAIAAVFAADANMQMMCSREKGLCGLETRALMKGFVLLGVTRAGTTPTALHVHVFKLSQQPDRRARIKAFLFEPDNPSAGHGVMFMRHGPGEYRTKINWDITTPMELAVRVQRKGMADQVVYFKLKPGMEPETL